MAVAFTRPANLLLAEASLPWTHNKMKQWNARTNLGRVRVFPRRCFFFFFDFRVGHYSMISVVGIAWKFLRWFLASILSYHCTIHFITTSSIPGYSPCIYTSSCSQSYLSTGDSIVALPATFQVKLLPFCFYITSWKRADCCGREQGIFNA